MREKNIMPTSFYKHILDISQTKKKEKYLLKFWNIFH